MGFKKIVALWFASGLIVTLLSILWAYISGGLFGALSEVIIEAAFAELFFPFDLIIGWSLNPIAIILQVILFICFLFFSFRDNAGD